MPTPTYPHDHSLEQEKLRITIDGKEHVYPDQLAWPGIATLPGLPSTAIPTGFAPDGLPLGVQIVGPWLEDPTPLKLAELIEREFGGFVPPKMFDDCKNNDQRHRRTHRAQSRLRRLGAEFRR